MRLKRRRWVSGGEIIRPVISHSSLVIGILFKNLVMVFEQFNMLHFVSHRSSVVRHLSSVICRLSSVVPASQLPSFGVHLLCMESRRKDRMMNDE